MKTFKLFVKSLLVLIILSNITACNISAGSYPDAERYELNVNEASLIKAIQDFKKNNPQYIVPEQTQLIDGRDDNDRNDHWYHVYFYYPEENQIIYTWTRPAENGKTTFAFVSINEGLRLGKWKDINKDFSRSENKAELKKFEERILNKIKEKL